MEDDSVSSAVRNDEEEIEEDTVLLFLPKQSEVLV
jgi:hypothetical protein